MNNQPVFDKQLALILLIFNRQDAGFVRRVQRLHKVFEADRAEFPGQALFKLAIVGFFAGRAQPLRENAVKIAVQHRIFDKNIVEMLFFQAQHFDIFQRGDGRRRRIAGQQRHLAETVAFR